MLEMVLPGKRRRGRPKRRYMDSIREDIREVVAKEADTQNRTRWRALVNKIEVESQRRMHDNYIEVQLNENHSSMTSLETFGPLQKAANLKQNWMTHYPSYFKNVKI